MTSVVVVALFASACSSETAAPEVGPALERQVPGISFAAAEDVIALGWVLDRSSPAARTEQRHYDALESAVGNTNDSGGLRGIPIELRGLDTGGDVAVALDGLRRLASSGVQMVVIGCDPVVAPALATRAAGLSMLSVSLCSGSPSLGFDAGGANFTLGVADAVQGRVLADAALDAGWVSIAIVSDLSDANASAQCDAIENRFAQAEGEVRVRHELLGSAGDIEAAVVDLQRFSSPDGFVVCARPTVVEELALQLRTVWSQPVLVTASAEPALLDGLAGALPGVAYLAPVETDRGGVAASAAWLSVLDATLPATIVDPLNLDLDDLVQEILALEDLPTELGSVSFTEQGARSPDGLGLVTEGTASTSVWDPSSRIPLPAPSPPGTEPHPATVETTTTLTTTIVTTTNEPAAS